MKCPNCKQDNDKVVDSRNHEDWIRRRRKCLSCGESFTTYETVSTTKQVGPPTQPFPLRSAHRVKQLANMIISEMESPSEPSLTDAVLALQHRNELVKRTT